MVDFIVERGIAAVFVETSVSDKNVKALIEGAQARGHPLRIGGELFSDAMGAAGTYEGTYIGMVSSNARTIAKALRFAPGTTAHNPSCNISTCLQRAAQASLATTPKTKWTDLSPR